MSITEFVEMLSSEIKTIGSAKKAAAAWGISPQYLSEILRYRRDPGRKILDEFGMYKCVSYELKDVSGIAIAQEAEYVENPIGAVGGYKKGRIIHP